MAKRMISLEIPEELREALRREAFERDETISAVIREILEEHLHVTYVADKKEDE